MADLDFVQATSRYLRERGVTHALIGAGALAQHGFARGTQDLNLLVLTPAVLHKDWWEDLKHVDSLDVFDSRQEPADPLLGVVRLASTSGALVDVIVGRHRRWQQPILDRAGAAPLPRLGVPVAAAADLVLLKLFAGSRRDDRDIEDLLSVRPQTRAEVDGRIDEIPAEERQRWTRLCAGLDREA